MVLIATVVPCRNSCAAAKLRAGLADAGLDAGDQPLRRGQRLAEPERAGRLVERRDVGEGAADVGRQAQRGLGWYWSCPLIDHSVLHTHDVISRSRRQIGDEAVRRLHAR